MSPRGRIGRFGRVGRRPDYWSSPHERARNRAAERLEVPLAAREAAWLEAHLAECEPCRTIAEAYTADRLALRQLREVPAEPPRDLWARTAAGIEREAARQRGGALAGGARAERRRLATSRPALGILSGLSVVAVVVIATVISGGFLGRVGLDATGPEASIALASQAVAEPTAMAVGAGQVHWLGAGEDGAFAYNMADIDVVCARDRQPDCAPFADGHARRVTLNATPRFVFQSPVDDQAIVVGTDANGADAVLIVALPAPDPTPTVPPDASPTTATATAGSPAASHDVPTTAVPATAEPSAVVATSVASLDPNASGSIGPGPSDATAVAIITDVTIVGRASSFSPDGAWFAFSARPADGSAGPDIYVWHVGELQARALTTDHASVFASWVGGSILGSRLSAEPASPAESGAPADPAAGTPPPEASPAPDGAASPEPVPTPERIPETFLLDPWTGAEVALLAAEWQPAVDPTGLAVVAWQGTVGLDPSGLTAAPATGNLVIHPFHGPLEFDDPTASPSLPPDSPPVLSPAPSAIDAPSASPQIVEDFPVQIVAAGPIADFDARWDETGSWLAIWLADPLDPTLGRLSLLHFDPYTGFVDRPLGAPQDVTALPGFSIGYGRLAWASPPGQSGEGSRIQIAAWASGEVGAVESVPVVGAIVVQ